VTVQSLSKRCIHDADVMDEQIQAIHQASLDILGQPGL